jgi:nucleoside-diphosphate-sugar epimerase
MTAAAKLLEDAHPELVFHLAAEVGGIGANRANPGRYWYANLVMGAHVLEQSRLHEVGKLVIAGTVCAYPKHAPVPFREVDLWDGYPEETNAPYGVAKKAVLVGGQAYREQYGLNAIYLLPANLYGPRDNFDLQSSHVIAALIRKMLESKDEVVLWGDGTPTREFLHVDDCVEGLLLAGSGTTAGSVNPHRCRDSIETWPNWLPRSPPRGRSSGIPRCRTASHGGRLDAPGRGAFGFRAPTAPAKVLPGLSRGIASTRKRMVG